MVVACRFTRAEVRQLLATAKRVMRCTVCDILLMPAVQKEGRILVVTPRRIGTAPQRNTIRRRLKAIFRIYHFDQAGYDCAVIVKTSGVDVESSKLKEYLIMAFAKVGYDAQDISNS